MKTLNTIIAVLMLQILAWYGYAHSMTAEGFMIQGYIGTALPVIIGALLFCAGMITAEGKQS